MILVLCNVSKNNKRMMIDLSDYSQINVDTYAYGEQPTIHFIHRQDQKRNFDLSVNPGVRVLEQLVDAIARAYADGSTIVMFTFTTDSNLPGGVFKQS